MKKRTSQELEQKNKRIKWSFDLLEGYEEKRVDESNIQLHLNNQKQDDYFV